MTEDQSGQAVQAAPATYFHKVASAAHRNEPGLLAPADGADSRDDVAAVASPDGLNAGEDEDVADDYTSTRPNPVAAGGDRDEVVPVTRADALASSAAAEPGPGPGGYGDLVPDTADLRARWREIQFMFVDDPRASVTEAADAIEQAAARLLAAIRQRQSDLRGRWDGEAHADTETLRETLRMYRAFLYQLIGSGG